MFFEANLKIDVKNVPTPDLDAPPVKYKVQNFTIKTIFKSEKCILQLCIVLSV